MSVAQEHLIQPTTGTQSQYHQTPEAMILGSGVLVSSSHIATVRIVSNHQAVEKPCLWHRINEF